MLAHMPGKYFTAATSVAPRLISAADSVDIFESVVLGADCMACPCRAPWKFIENFRVCVFENESQIIIICDQTAISSLCSYASSSAVSDLRPSIAFRASQAFRMIV